MDFIEIRRVANLLDAHQNKRGYSENTVCVDCLFLRSPSRVPYRTNGFSFLSLSSEKPLLIGEMFNTLRSFVKLSYLGGSGVDGGQGERMKHASVLSLSMQRNKATALPGRNLLDQ